MLNIEEQAMSAIRSRKASAEASAEQNLQYLLGKPEFLDNYDEIQQQILVVARSFGTAKEKVEKNKLNMLRQKQLNVVSNLGLNPTCLFPNYSCKICNDNGYLDGKKCQCLDQEIRKILYKNVNQGNKNFTFASSSDRVNVVAYSSCKEFCLSYPSAKYLNMLIMGKSGVGKTYLCSAIANQFIDKEVETLFLTAYELNNKFLSIHLAELDRKLEMLESLQSVPVLIIDDLGAEQIFKNVTLEYFFALINQRNFARLTTIISTNLSLTNILSRYTERTFSRLANKHNTLLIELVGADKRLSK
ncbi:MAG: ATP-binding protein [Clostridia bacterium]